VGGPGIRQLNHFRSSSWIMDRSLNTCFGADDIFSLVLFSVLEQEVHDFDRDFFGKFDLNFFELN
jgi:hypothetical protein